MKTRTRWPKPLAHVGRATTRAQRDVLELVALGVLMGEPPTLSELAACLGFRSTQGVAQKIAELGARGLVRRRGKYRARIIEVTPLGWRELGWPACGECGRFCIPRE